MSTSGIFQLAKDGDSNGLLYYIQDHIDDINKQDSLGCTALIYAAWGGFMNIALLLINVGCDLNIQNKWGYTALHLAAENGRLDIVKLLVQSGASVYIRNEEGNSPCDIAKNEPIAEYLNGGRGSGSMF